MTHFFHVFTRLHILLLLSCHYLDSSMAFTSYMLLRHSFPKTYLDLKWYYNDSFNKSTRNNISFMLVFKIL